MIQTQNLLPTPMMPATCCCCMAMPCTEGLMVGVM